MANIADCSVAISKDTPRELVEQISNKINECAYEYGCDEPVYHDECITFDFGGRWDFPEAIENYLNDLDIAWQGAGVEDGCDWRYEFGNEDFGLRIVPANEIDESNDPDWHAIDLREDLV